jgi:hypothetical protein
MVRDYGGRAAQSNALGQYDSLAAQNPQWSPTESLAVAHDIVQRYSLVEETQTPFAIGRPYGYSGSLGPAITPQVLQSAATKLQADKTAGRLSDTQFVQEQQRLRAWQEYLARRAAKPKAKAP